MLRLPRSLERWVVDTMMKDPRDAAMLSTMVNIVMTTLPLAALLFVYPSHLLGVAIVVRREENSREEQRRERSSHRQETGERDSPKRAHSNVFVHARTARTARSSPLRPPSVPHRATRSPGYSLGIPAPIRTPPLSPPRPFALPTFSLYLPLR